jgi:hypothetical protein
MNSSSRVEALELERLIHRFGKGAPSERPSGPAMTGNGSSGPAAQKENGGDLRTLPVASMHPDRATQSRSQATPSSAPAGKDLGTNGSDPHAQQSFVRDRRDYAERKHRGSLQRINEASGQHGARRDEGPRDARGMAKEDGGSPGGRSSGRNGSQEKGGTQRAYSNEAARQSDGRRYDSAAHSLVSGPGTQSNSRERRHGANGSNGTRSVGRDAGYGSHSEEVYYPGERPDSHADPGRQARTAPLHRGVHHDESRGELEGNGGAAYPAGANGEGGRMQSKRRERAYDVGREAEWSRASDGGDTAASRNRRAIDQYRAGPAGRDLESSDADQYGGVGAGSLGRGEQSRTGGTSRGRRDEDGGDDYLETRARRAGGENGGYYPNPEPQSPRRGGTGRAENGGFANPDAMSPRRGGAESGGYPDPGAQFPRRAGGENGRYYPNPEPRRGGAGRAENGGFPNPAALSPRRRGAENGGYPDPGAQLPERPRDPHRGSEGPRRW